MNRIAFGFLCLALLPSVGAQVRQLPYEARVIRDDTYVRSGAGEEKFYPTQILKSGATVTVLRHDPGGWFMIEPPEGSFSWVLEKHVRQNSGGTGEVIESNAVVFVGSSFGDETNVWQRRLMSGEKVKILGSQIVDTLSGPKRMLKIEPPSREYRWIPGASVIPLGETQRSQHDRDPYSVPSNLVRREATARRAADTETEKHTSGYSPSRQLARLKQLREEQRQLKEIDQKFRTMILSGPQNWNLREIEQEYRDLQNKATHKPLAGQIDLRYPAIQRYRQRKAKLDELNELTSSTEKRDADLLAQQYGPAATSFAQTPFPEWQQNQISVAERAPRVFLPDTATAEKTDNPFAMTGQSEVLSNTDSQVPKMNIPSGSRYIGVGLVSRGGNGNVLLTTRAGRVLAHLESDTVDLNSLVGSTVGLQGKRYFDETVKTDRIEVDAHESVRLK